jgi:hypothetical protein
VVPDDLGEPHMPATLAGALHDLRALGLCHLDNYIAADVTLMPVTMQAPLTFTLVTCIQSPYEATIVANTVVRVYEKLG